jgi:hypothetical protein
LLKVRRSTKALAGDRISDLEGPGNRYAVSEAVPGTRW